MGLRDARDAPGLIAGSAASELGLQLPCRVYTRFRQRRTRFRQRRLLIVNII